MMPTPRALLPWLIRILPLLLAVILWQPGGSLAIDVGTLDDEDVVQQFFAREQGDNTTYRWSSYDSTLRLPARFTPAILTIDGAVAPNGTQVSLHTVGDNGLNIALPPHTGVPIIRQYALLLPPRYDPYGWVDLHIQAAPAEGTVALEERPLGFLIDRFSLQTGQVSSVQIPPLLLLLMLTLIPLTLETGLRFASVRPRWSLGIGAGVGTAIVGFWWLHPLWIQQFLPYVMAASVVIAAMIGWTRWSTAGSRTTADCPHTFILLIAWSGIIPLYLFLRYGLDNILNPDNLPIAAMALALLYPLVGRQGKRVLAVGMVLALAGYGITNYYSTLSTDYTSDFTALFRGPRSFLNGENPYNLEVINSNHLVMTFKYPPFFIFLMGPLTGLHYVAGLFTWRAINIALFIGALVLFYRWSEMPLRSWSTVGLLLLIATYQPLNYTIGFGQFDIFILIVLAASLIFMKHGKWGWFGALLAFPAAVKFYPAYFVAHAVAWRKWRSVLTFTMAFVVLWGLALVFMGWEIHRIYIVDVIPTLRSGTVWPENQTINGFLNRLTAHTIEFGADGPGFIRLLAYVAMASLSLLTLLRVQKMDMEHGLGLWVVAVLIIIPIAWIHYQTILLLPMYQLFVRMEQQPGRIRWQTLLLYGMAWMMLCYGSHWAFFDQTYHGPLWALVLSYKLYGLVFLWVALAYDVTAQREETTGDEMAIVPIAQES